MKADKYDAVPLHAAAPGRMGELQEQGGASELAARQALLAAIAEFRAAVDATLPGMYVWFSDASLHITLRALIN